jgi:MOSC domain-containing protein
VGYDLRRFRPNLVIRGVPGLSERQWEEAQLRIAPVVIGMEDLRTRCIMTTFDPDSGQQDLGMLRRIRREFNGRLGPSTLFGLDQIVKYKRGTRDQRARELNLFGAFTGARPVSNCASSACAKNRQPKAYRSQDRFSTLRLHRCGS